MRLLEIFQSVQFNEDAAALYQSLHMLDATDEAGLVVLVAAARILAAEAISMPHLELVLDEFHELAEATFRHINARPVLRIVGGTDVS